MTDIRARLADALRGVWESSSHDEWCNAVIVDRICHSLLSLPGIAIVDTEAIDSIAKAMWDSEREGLWDVAGQSHQSRYRSLARAALAAAVQAQEPK